MLAMTSLDIEPCLWCMQDFAEYAIIYQLKQNLLFDILPNHEKSWFFGSIGVIKLLIDIAILITP